jgi:methyl-accepting chemotaxis protein
MAIPLAQVVRVAEFPRSALERAGPTDVVQARGEILPLIHVSRVLGGRRSPRNGRRAAGRRGHDPLGVDSETIQAVICTTSRGRVALEVGSILDVVEETVASRSRALRPGVLFTAVVQGRVTEFLDVEGILQADRLDTERALHEAAERERRHADELRVQLAHILEALDAVGRGDLTRELPAEAVGQAGESLGKFLGNLRDRLATIAQTAQTLTASSRALTTVSQRLAATAEDATTQANGAAAAADQVRKHVTLAATVAEQMGAGTGKLARGIDESAEALVAAMTEAEKANHIVTRLAEGGAALGDVLGVLASAARQTNRLALNAAIAAARAGEGAGGVTAVADEVKELAEWTARATRDVSHKLEALQADSRAAVDAVARVGKTVSRLNDLQKTLAGAVEEQTAAAAEIGRQGGRAAAGSGEIARSLVEVAQAARGTTAEARNTRNSAEELAAVAQTLRRLAAEFKY